MTTRMMTVGIVFGLLASTASAQFGGAGVPQGRPGFPVGAAPGMPARPQRDRDDQQASLPTYLTQVPSMPHVAPPTVPEFTQVIGSPRFNGTSVIHAPQVSEVPSSGGFGRGLGLVAGAAAAAGAAGAAGAGQKKS